MTRTTGVLGSSLEEGFVGSLGLNLVVGKTQLGAVTLEFQASIET